MNRIQGILWWLSAFSFGISLMAAIFGIWMVAWISLLGTNIMLIGVFNRGG